MHSPADDLYAVNESKGCSGVMRVAPVGLIARDPATVFGFGSATACLTNGHPSGCLSAGRLAALINGIVAGTRRKAVPADIALLKNKEGTKRFY